MANLGENIKKLGFGLMRLPKNGEKIDIEETKKMVDLFMSEGFTYFDTAWGYGGSEEAIREALVKRYPRESYQLATKIAPWIRCESREEAVKQLEVSLERTGAGYFDFYLLHNLGGGRSHFFDDYGIWDFVKEKKAEGLVKHIGFSCHTTPEEMEEIFIKHPEMEFVQLQINYADWENPSVQSRKCYETARKYNKPVIIMEPVKGGMLADPPKPVRAVLDGAESGLSYAGWAVKFAADLDGVITVLSGMSNTAQMEDNLSYMKEFSGLSELERATLKSAQAAMAEIPLIPCTTCGYCTKVCPMNIGIPGSFTAMNTYTLFENLQQARNQESWQVGGRGYKKAAECIQCGRCEDACPQHIEIRKELKRVTELLG